MSSRRLLLLTAVVLLGTSGCRSREAQLIADGNYTHASADKIDQANENKLVKVEGIVSSPEIFTDEDYGVSVEALMMRRDVEKVSSQSSNSKSSSGVTARRMEAPEGEEPGPFHCKKWWSQSMSIGKYKIDPQLLEPTTNRFWQEIPIENLETIPVSKLAKLKRLRDEAISVFPREAQSDLRVRFLVLSPGKAEIIGKQVNGTLMQSEGSAYLPESQSPNNAR
ncbi:MAG: hypothetical protein SGJ27_13285 [Candidatus Melainabacteria bacterium]|nr:hypothetical protein [Candidatus Melainabacteria bacterium]